MQPTGDLRADPAAAASDEYHFVLHRCHGRKRTIAGLQAHPEQCVNRACYQLGSRLVVTAVFKGIGGPTIKCGNCFGSVQIVGQISPDPRDEVRGVRTGGQPVALRQRCTGQWPRRAPASSRSGRRGSARRADQAVRPTDRRPGHASPIPGPGCRGSWTSCARPSRSFRRARSGGRIGVRH